MRVPARRPCGSCPYRCDVPSGVWDRDEYAKLARYDGETWDQPPSVFLCHQQDGRICAGWVGVHDMPESFGLRVAAIQGLIEIDDLDEIYAYQTDVPLFASGAEAEAHGLREVGRPGPAACEMIATLERKRGR